MKIITTKKGQQILVDDENFERLNRYNWHIHDGYACWATTVNRKTVRYRMHRIVLGLDIGREDSRLVDHVNRNKLDNRKENLRIVDRTLNNGNRNKFKSNKSGYKGVHYIGQDQRQRRWIATITHNSKLITIGSYLTAEEAYKAYCDKAMELRGFI